MKKETDNKDKNIVKHTFFLIFLIFLLGFFVFLNQNPEYFKKMFRPTATSVGLTEIVPWVDRAAIATKNIIANSEENIAHSIVYSTHTMVSNPKMENFEVSKSGQIIDVFFECSFTGDFFQTNYRIKAKWSFTEHKSFGVKILFDNTLIGATPAGIENINEYFNEKVYPIVLRNID